MENSEREEKLLSTTASKDDQKVYVLRNYAWRSKGLPFHCSKIINKQWSFAHNGNSLTIFFFLLVKVARPMLLLIRRSCHLAWPMYLSRGRAMLGLMARPIRPVWPGPLLLFVLLILLSQIYGHRNVQNHPSLRLSLVALLMICKKMPTSNLSKIALFEHKDSPNRSFQVPTIYFLLNDDAVICCCDTFTFVCRYSWYVPCIISMYDV